jgi:alginate O-acetyltransferase complex protein AlgI
MLFTQFEFIFIFLPITLGGYFLLGMVVAAPVARLVWLAGASLIFYAYWNTNLLPVIGVSVAANYTFGLAVTGLPAKSRSRKIVFVAAIAANLLALAVFKYTNFAVEIYNDLAHRHVANLPIVLPLGISFFTFTQIAYLADVFSGHPHERNFVKYLLFVTYFPHLIAGPILHHREMMPQFGSESSRRLSSDRIAVGLTVFAVGLFKKTVVADGFALIANPVFAAAAQGQVSMIDGWSGALAYSLQIYFDFSGYCDMALGLSTMFGIVLPFNFDAPYKSLSIVEFWRRWHITLSRFLRDYLYIPLGGSRYGDGRRYMNLLTTMVLGGLWHGAGWTYIIWGALHGLYLVINHRWIGLTAQRPALSRIADTDAYAFAMLLLTQLCVIVAWVFFRAENLRVAQRMLSAMFGASSVQSVAAANAPLPLASIVIGYIACVCLPNVNEIFRDWRLGFTTYDTPPPRSFLSLNWVPTNRWAVVTAAMLLVGVLVTLVAGERSQFLYFQF